jgi:DMSO/TMAO reductase YedYZ molybdopterin-dependent catalytic subunit
VTVHKVSGAARLAEPGEAITAQDQDYQRSLPVEEATGEDVLLAYAMNGAERPAQHGLPAWGESGEDVEVRS